MRSRLDRLTEILVIVSALSFFWLIIILAGIGFVKWWELGP